MKKRFSSLFGSKGSDNLAGDNLPWLDSQSIYAHILNHLEPDTGRLLPSGETLPDEERRYAGSQLRWVPGAMEGVFSHHVSAEESEHLAQQVVKSVTQIAQKNADQAKIDLYKLLLKDELLAFIDNALPRILQPAIPPEPHLHSFALFLARTAPDRGPVKFAIALLGGIGDPRDVDLVAVLGRHEEFTLYSGVALANMLEQPEFALWELAKKVSGWGRIHIVERLAGTQSPRIKAWLLREGFRNAVMYEYLAYPCAVGGDLKSALEADDVDEDLICAAGEIIEALITGGPAEDINGYADAGPVAARYLELLGKTSIGLEHFLVADMILGYLTAEDWSPVERAANGWTDALRDQAIVLANQILQRPDWRELVQRDLTTGDELHIQRALHAADLLGIETWTFHWERLLASPFDSGRWYYLVQKATPQRIDEVISLAQRSLPLKRIASGPANQLGMGPEFRAHQCLEAVVQELGRFPGKGWPLISASLRSPVIRNRNQALRVLAEWGKKNWPPEAVPELRKALAAEPETDVKARMKQLLHKGKLDT